MLDEFSDIVAEEDAQFLAVAAQVAESAQHIHQHTQHKICHVCGDTGWVIVFQGSPTIPCQCPQGKLRASA